MRYGEISSEMYCEGIPDDSTDPVVGLAHEKAEISGKINSLRRDRWNFVCLSLENNEAIIKITNKIGMEASIGSESDLMKDLANYNEKFNKLNPLFKEIENKFPRLISPNSTGLKNLRAACISQIVKFKGHIKSELAYRMGIQSRNKTVDDVLSDPIFKEMKKNFEGYIEAEEAKLTQLNYYIAEVNKIVGGD